MKELIKSWKFWAVIVASVLVIVAVVLYFTVPKFTYATAGFLIGTLLGFVGGHFVAKKYVNQCK